MEEPAMPIRALVAIALLAAAAVVTAPPARADVLKERATLSYNPGAKKWDFLTDSFVSGHLNIVAKGIGKQLTKLKATGAIHSCMIQYDDDSKIEASNGNFYSAFKLSACD
jgi:hypothetical protein